ncbi:MAG: metalloregulator ArsR/SmtB family transcription factor [Actinomycetota bacterium]
MQAGRPAIIEREAVQLSETELTARVFRALGDATRLRILRLLLNEGELHQMEIVRRLGATQARISEHMTCLIWCGFVFTRTEGRRNLYRVADPRVAKLVEMAQSLLEDNQAQIASCRTSARAEREQL